VGTANKYGTKPNAEVATVKLARLCGHSVALLTAGIFKKKKIRMAKIKIPCFIGLFIVCDVTDTYVAEVR
jgi:hypothetical protein